MKCLGTTLAFACAAYACGYGFAEPTAAAENAATMPEHVGYQRSGCSPLPFDETALAGRLRVELAEDGAKSLDIMDEQVDAARRFDAVVKILGACSGGELVVVIEGRTGLPVRRPVDLRGMDRALRERALAIAIAELLRARWGELAPTAARTGEPHDPEPRPHAAACPEKTQPTPPATSRQPGKHDVFARDPPKQSLGAPVLLSGGIEWRFLFEGNTTLTGGRIAASLPAGSDWLVRLSAEAAAFYDSDRNIAGMTELWLATGNLGVSAGYHWASAEIGAGPRLELGWGEARRTSIDVPAPPASHGNFIIVASAIATGRARLTPRVWLSLDLEIGHVLRGIDAHPLGKSPAGIRGALGGGRVGVALGL